MRALDRETFAYANIGVPFDTSFLCYFTGNASVHRASALAIGGFDEAFPHWHEDIEFAYRLRRHGVRFVFAADAVVHHLREVTLAATLAAQAYKGRELMRLFAKHPELRGYLPIDRLADPSSQSRLFDAALHQALLIGVGEGVAALDETDPLLGLLRDEQERWVDRRVGDLQAEVDRLTQERDQMRRQAEENRRLQQELARLERAFQAQATWAAELAERLTQPRRIARWRQPAEAARERVDAGLEALLALRRRLGRRSE
jgi:hypothetical protein